MLHVPPKYGAITWEVPATSGPGIATYDRKPNLLSAPNAFVAAVILAFTSSVSVPSLLTMLPGYSRRIG